MVDNEAIIDRYYEELFTEGDLDVAAEILAPEIEYHGPRSVTPGTLTSRTQVEKFVERYHGAFPDIDYQVEEQLSGGNKVAVRWSSTGTHTEELFGLEGQGKEFTGTGLNLFTIEDGQIVEVWSYWDTLGMVRELGLVAPMGLASRN